MGSFHFIPKLKFNACIFSFFVHSRKEEKEELAGGMFGKRNPFEMKDKEKWRVCEFFSFSFFLLLVLSFPLSNREVQMSSR